MQRRCCRVVSYLRTHQRPHRAAERDIAIEAGELTTCLIQLQEQAAIALQRSEADINDLLRRFRWLVGKVTSDHWFAATVLPQLHVLTWGNKRGV